jgi:hypothetical protein
MDTLYSTWAYVPDGVMVRCPVTGLRFIKADGVATFTADQSLSAGWVSEVGLVPRDLYGFVRL